MKTKVVKKVIKTFTEVPIQETAFDRSYTNPLTKTYQYEYALLQAISKLFASIQCNSVAWERLKMYYMELPHSSPDTVEQNLETAKKKTQESILNEMLALVQRDIVGHVTFPQMNICAAQVYIIPDNQDHHTFFFTDDIYGFSVKLSKFTNGRPTALEVADI